jgi:hypothetical protein
MGCLRYDRGQHRLRSDGNPELNAGLQQDLTGKGLASETPEKLLTKLSGFCTHAKDQAAQGWLWRHESGT